MPAKRYLITGGTGFIGRNVTRAMVKDGFTVRVLDNNFRGNLESLNDISKDFEFIPGDIRDETAVRKACKSMDGVIHLAAINGTKFFYSIPEVVLDVSTRGITNVIDGCLWHGVEDILFASSSEVYQTPAVIPTPENIPMVIPDGLNPRYSYAGGKIISELFVLNYGRKYFRKAIIFRPHNVFGPEMGWEHVIPQFTLRLKELARNDAEILKFPIQGDGKERRAFTFIDDFVDGFMLVLNKGAHMNVYNIGGEEEVDIKKLAEEIGKFFSKKIAITAGKRQVGGTTRRLPDISKIKDLGFSTKYPFSEGLHITVSWYNENAEKKPPALII